jgi:hypothetical protein
MANPVVRLVTPAHPNDDKKSQDAFEDMLNRLHGSINYKAYYGFYDPGKLTIAARKAVADARGAVAGGQRAVIVAAGTSATNILQGLTTAPADLKIPIIQAVGGAPPTVVQANLTGFVINARATALAHLAAPALSTPVAVLYDDTPPATTLSNIIYAALQAAAPAAGKALMPLTARTPAVLQTLNLPAGANSFMLIPNAMYYNNCYDVANIVDGRQKADGTPLPIYYPEREYKNAHRTTNGVTVLGHNVPLTYRLAAIYVDSILDGSLTTLPAFIEATPDQD